ncbi:hypothetical protein BJG01_08320 [Vibrio splendidus]|nr:hypothetical protein BJG01_08320 [Vibrio splendidus]URM14413.1 glycosyltransferase family 4 protein [Vibrio splendidus]
MTKKILIVTSELKFSGPNNVILSLLHGCHSLGYTTSLFGLRSKVDNDFVSKASEFTLNIQTKTNKFFMIYDLLMKIIHYKPDIINTHGIRADLYVYFLRFLFPSIEVVSTIHNVPFEDYKNRYPYLIAELMLKFHSLVFKSKSYKKIAVSKNVMASLVKNGSSNVNYVYNGVISSDFTRRSDDIFDLNVKLGLKPETVKVLFCGHFTNIKQPKIVYELSKFYPHIDFIFLGDGPLTDQIDASQVNVHVMGRVRNVSDYMYVSDYLIIPSITEGMPMAFIEGLFSSLIPICSNIEIFKELSSIDGLTIQLFEVGNLESLKDSFDDLLKLDSYNSNNLVAMKNFSSIVMSERYIEVIYNE